MIGLLKYERMRSEIAVCANIEEVLDIHDKAKALAAYAREHDDKDLDAWMSEIRLRACGRIGELSLELEKAEHGGAAGKRWSMAQLT